MINEPFPGWLEAAVDTREASRILSIPVSTLITMRCRGGGPRFYRPKGTRLIRYRRCDLFDWLMKDGPLDNTSVASAIEESRG